MKRTKCSYRVVSLILTAVLLAGCFTGCAGGGKTTDGPASNQPAAEPTGAPIQTSESVQASGSVQTSEPVQTTESPQTTGFPQTDTGVSGILNIGYEPGFGSTGEKYVPVEVTPRVAGYSVSPDLSNVVNLDQFPNLTAEQKEKLAGNGFVVASGNQEQLFYIYEDNTYKKIPNFVTTDSVLQVYHVFYDYALRSIEGAALLPDVLTLNTNMLIQLLKEYSAISKPEVKAEALKVLGYFGTAQLALGQALPSDFPAEIADLVRSEINLVRTADGIHESPLFGYELDYSLFTPRGHYTRSGELKKYFRAMSWYGIVPFPFYKSDGVTRDTQSAMRAIIAAAALFRLPESGGGRLWENIYSATAFFVGSADDITPYQLAGAVEKVFGTSPDLNEISDPGKLDLFYQEAEALPSPQISTGSVAAAAGETGIPSGLQFRFMGQRYIPDSEILQELSDPVSRPFPTGLDVFASLGSERAADIIAELYRPADTWPEYTENFARMREKFTALPDSTWQSNMYYAWLWTQNSLTGEYGEGYPMFMRNTAWQDKSLSTALGSWAEMRHDTILYAKAEAAECGWDDVEPPVVRAYVEPNAELYNRLLWLTSYSRENLSARGILPEAIEYACENFEEMLAFLRDCSIKELSGEDLTAEEYDSLLTYGGLLESLTTSSIENGYQWFQLESETDRNMAVIADVHTVFPGSYLEEAVGTASEIYVVVPMGGELYLTRGAVFDYHEFVSQERLTDEKWQAMLLETEPESPPFTSSYTAGEAMEVPTPAEPYSTGC